MSCCFRCCCSQDYSALTRIESCYPSDSRYEPINARVNELVNWGNHDVERFASIHEILAEKINHDVIRSNDAGVSIGLKIFSSLLERVRELNLNISLTMTACIIRLIETKRLSLLEIVKQSTASLIQFTQRHTLSVPIQRIVHSLLEISSDDTLKEISFETIAVIASLSSIEWLPLIEIFTVTRSSFPQENSARNIIIAISKAVVPLTLPKLCGPLFLFLDQINLWNSESFLSSFIITLLTDMSDNCSPVFFRSWLEQLPPKSPETGHCKTIISISIRLIEQLPPEKLISQSSTVALTVLFLFVMTLPTLIYDDKATILDNTLLLVKFIVSNIHKRELLIEAHREIWEWLPNGTEGTIEYDHEKVGLLFRFASVFNEGATSYMSNSIITESLGKVLKFLEAFRHDDNILTIITDHIKGIYVSYPPSRIECVVSFLLALQKDLKQNSDDTTLHTLIMCAFFDVSIDGPPPFSAYIQDVCRQRLASSPPQFNSELSIFISRFPAFKDIRSNGQTGVTIRFKKKIINDIVSPGKNRNQQHILRTISDLRHIKEDNASDDELNHELLSRLIEGPSLILNQEDNASDSIDAEQIPPDLNDAVAKIQNNLNDQASLIHRIEDLPFEWSSKLKKN